MSTALQQQQTQMDRVKNTLWKMESRLLEALPKDRDVKQEISSVIATVASSPALQKCTPESIALAAYDAATLGLPVNKLGLAWLVPFGNEAKFQIGYRGYIQLVMETGFVLEVTAECVYENDRFHYRLGSNPSIEHEPTELGKKRGALVGVYALAKLANGLVKHVVMDKAQVDHIRSKSRSSSNGPWVTDYDEMAKKTVVKRLCKMLPFVAPKVLQKVELAEQIEQRTWEDFDQQQPKQLSVTPIAQQETIEADYTPVEDEHAALASRIIDLQEAIKGKDKKAEPLPDLDQLTVGDLETLLARKEKHWELVK